MQEGNEKKKILREIIKMQKKKCICLEYGESYINSFGFGLAHLIEEGKRVRECTYSMDKECYCAFCVQCPEHLKINNQEPDNLN